MFQIPRRLLSLSVAACALLVSLAPASAAAQVSGVVYDGIEGAPLGGARVSVVDSEFVLIRETRTDAVGRFQIDGDGGTWLVPAFPTYASTPVRLNGSDTDLLLPLWPRTPAEERIVETARAGEADDAMVVGFVTDATTGRALAGAQVRLAARGMSTLTGPSGRFAFDPVQPGVVVVEVSMIGYEPREIAVPVEPGRAFNLQLPLATQAIRLDGIEVTTTSRFVARRLQDAYRRSEVAPRGRYVMREEIEARSYPSIGEMMQGRPSVRMQRAGALTTLQIRGCVPSLWLDGVQVGDPGDAEAISEFMRWPTFDVEMVEVFPSAASLPPEFNDVFSAGCAIAVWTRRGG